MDFLLSLGLHNNTMDWKDVIFRSILAVILGLLIGVERSMHGRAAGMRTHVLVCLGSAMTAMTGIYVNQLYGSGDVLRLAAQVISGVGFLGAGMIVLKNNSMITGLTTAAGVWATATVGIAVGYGFWFGALVVVLLFLIALILFVKFERRKKNTEVLYLEIDDMSRINPLTESIRAMIPKDPVFRVLEPKSGYSGHIGLEVVVDRRQCPPLEQFLSLEGIIFAIEI